MLVEELVTPSDANDDVWKGMEWKDKVDINKEPVLGVITQSLENYMQGDPRFKDYKSYVMVDYVRYLEASGARVIPIVYNETAAVTQDKMDHIDGVLFPGGDGDYDVLGRRVFDEVIKKNDAGQFFPAWGICLGYENMVKYTSSIGWDILDHFYIDTASLPLQFVKLPMKTRFYENLGKQAFDFVKSNFTYNSHSWGMDPKKMMADKGLSSFWDLTAVSFMPNNGTHPMPFVASIEAKKYPIFGTQYHPEKPSELWIDGKAINHAWESIDLQRHFSETFVKMSRAVKNSYGNWTETDKHLISNFDVIHTAEQGEVYVFH